MRIQLAAILAVIVGLVTGVLLRALELIWLIQPIALITFTAGCLLLGHSIIRKVRGAGGLQKYREQLREKRNKRKMEKGMLV
jgi:hypothetical protein